MTGPSGQPSAIRLQIAYGEKGSLPKLAVPRRLAAAPMSRAGSTASNSASVGAQQAASTVTGPSAVTDQAPSTGAGQPGSSGGGHLMNLSVVEARNLQLSLSGFAELCACVSLLREPQAMTHEHFLLIDHEEAPAGSARDIRMAPQYRTLKVPATADPSWSDTIVLRDTQPAISDIEKMHQSGALGSSTARVPLDGTGVLMLVTVHELAGGAGEDAFAGRVVIPQIQMGQPVDQWFMLQV